MLPFHILAVTLSAVTYSLEKKICRALKQHRSLGTSMLTVKESIPVIWVASRPIVFLDFETDGYGEPDPAKDRIIQIGFMDISPEGNAGVRAKLFHPGLDFMPLRRTEIHGITDAMLEGAPVFAAVARSLHDQLSGCDIATFGGSNYDIPLLWEEFYRAGIDWDTKKHKLVDVGTLWRKMEPRTLSDAVRRFTKSEPSSDMHDAGVDARWTCDVLTGMLEVWPDAPREIDGLAQLTIPTRKIGGKDLEQIDLAGVLVRDEQGEAVYSHKTNRGTRLKDDPGYADWILGKDFSANTKAAIRAELKKLEEEQTGQPSLI